MTSKESASRAMMVSLMDTDSCLTHIPACRVVTSPSLPELQLLPATQTHDNIVKDAEGIRQYLNIDQHLTCAANSATYTQRQKRIGGLSYWLAAAD